MNLVVNKFVMPLLCCCAGVLGAADVELTGANNVAGAQITLEAGDRLVVPAPAAAGGTFEIKARVLVNGAATLALPTAPAYDDVLVSGGLGTKGEGSLTVEGGSLLFGSNVARTYNDVHFPRFDVPISFTEPGAGITFTNAVTLHRSPSEDVSVAFAKGTLVALRGNSSFTRFMDMSGENPSFTATKDYTVFVHDEACFPFGTTVTVKPGATFGFKICRDKTDAATPDEAFWEWSGIESCPVTNITSIALESTAAERSRLVSACRKSLHLHADVSGDGDFLLDAVPLEHSDRTHLRGDCTFKGTVRIAGGNAALYFTQSSPGDPGNAVVFNGVARMGFEGFKDKPLPTEVRIASLYSASVGTQFWVNQGQTVTIGESRGDWQVYGSGPNTSCRVVVENLVNGTIYPGAPVGLKILSREDGRVKVLSYSGKYAGAIDLSECTGAWPFPVEIDHEVSLSIAGTEEGMLLVSGGGEIASVTGGMAIAPLSKGFDINVPSGAAMTVDPSHSGGSWQSKVDLWFDASCAESLLAYPEDVCYTNGYPLIKGWGDKRTGFTGRHLYNGRSLLSDGVSFRSANDRHDEVYPYVVTNGLNGLDYISMGSFGVYIHGRYQRTTRTDGTILEARRLIMREGTRGDQTDPNAVSSAAYAIMVFGSQQGGGRALLGVNGGTLVRNAATLANPFFSNYAGMLYADAQWVDGKTATPNGGWQILSIPLSGVNVNALGWSSGFSTSGGQNYAEVILFSSAPTDDEREACERYLAKKWGLTGNSAVFGNGSPVVSLQGAGDVTLTGDAEMNGGFCGNVTVPAGATLTVAHNPPPGDEAVPSENRLKWFDPDFDGALQFPIANDARAAGMRPRLADAIEPGEDGMSGLRGGSDRRPAAELVARGNGTERTWLNFANTVDGDSQGNTLRYQTTIGNNTADASFGDVREGFMVLDTVNGGGTPIGNDVNMTAVQRANSGRDASAPIWPFDPAQAVANNTVRKAFGSVETRLDGKVVDGFSHGFNGRPEVLSFAFTGSDAWAPRYFGFYAHGNSAAGNAEIIGESIFFSQVLDAATRREVISYLAWKWFGKALNGYTDLSRMTVDGAGRVEVAEAAHMPKFASGFSGVVACKAKDYAFTIAPATSRTEAGDAISAEAPFEIAAGARISIACTGALRTGEYRLVAGDVRFADSMPELDLGGIDVGAYNVSLVRTKDGLFLSVGTSGFMLIVR